MPEISVILPVYNVENYIEQCIESILSQTYTDFELICVNDGTEDKSRQIIERFHKKDKRVIIIDKENGGLSSARNAGLKNANGRFISFIDSDDWIRPDMLEKLYKNITDLNTDMTMCAVRLFDEAAQIFKDDNYFNLSIFPKNFDNMVFSFEDTKNFTMNIPVMAWNKLYRFDFLKQCNAKFEEGKIFEDGAFFFSVYFKTKRVAIVRESLYFYRINRIGSIVEKGGEKLFDIIDIVNLMFEELKQSEIFDEVKYDFFKQKADDIIYRYELLPANLKQKYSRKLKGSSCLFDERYFDYSLINKEEPVTYKKLCEIGSRTSILAFYRRKFIKRFMYKVIQILDTEKDIYYFKFWSLKIRIKKQKKFCDILYKKDKIYVMLFKKIKFSFNLNIQN